MTFLRRGSFRRHSALHLIPAEKVASLFRKPTHRHRSKPGLCGSAGANNALNTTRRCKNFRDENQMNSIARKSPTKTRWSLFAIERHLRREVLYPPELRARVPSILILKYLYGYRASRPRAATDCLSPDRWLNVILREHYWRSALTR